MALSSIYFDPVNPVPLLKVDSYTYQASKLHSEIVDDWLGFNMEEIETQLRKTKIENEQTWSDLSVQSFQTPYVEIRSALDIMGIQPGEKIVDLGSAYNRMGFIIGRYYPLNRYIGIELVESRVRHSFERIKLWNYNNLDLRVGNLNSIETPDADHYFIYDFGNNKSIQKVLDNLKIQARKKSIKVLARGRATRHFILNENPWLTQQIKPQHFEHFSLFQS